MAGKARPSQNKRNREQSRRDRRVEKADERKQRSIVRQNQPTAAPEHDPDIAHIVPGPQKSEFAD